MTTVRGRLSKAILRPAMSSTIAAMFDGVLVSPTVAGKRPNAVETKDRKANKSQTRVRMALCRRFNHPRTFRRTISISIRT